MHIYLIEQTRNLKNKVSLLCTVDFRQCLFMTEAYFYTSKLPADAALHN